MSKKSNNNVVESTRTREIAKSLGLKAEAVTENGYNVWVSAPADATCADALKGLGFSFAEKRNGWWKRIENPQAPAPKQAKAKAPKAPKAPKAEAKAPKQFEPLPASVRNAVLDEARKAFPSVSTITLEGTWVWIAGPETKAMKDALKADGWHFSGPRKAWGREIPSAWMPAQAEPKPAPKAPKAQAKPEAKAQAKPEVKFPEGEALIAVAEEIRKLALSAKHGKRTGKEFLADVTKVFKSAYIAD